MEVFTVYAANGKTDGKTDWDRVASFESDKEALAEMTRVSKKFACCCDMRKEERKTEQPNDNPCKECPTERHDCESCEHFDRGGQEEFTDKPEQPEDAKCSICGRLLTYACGAGLCNHCN